MPNHALNKGGSPAGTRTAEISRWRLSTTSTLLVVFTVFQVLVSAAWFQIDHRPPRWDESHYLSIAEYSYGQLRAGHMIRALDLHGVSSTKPGVAQFLSALTFFIVGHSPAVATFLIDTGSLLAIAFALIVISNELLKSVWVGVLAALCFDAVPIVMVWSGIYQIDLPLTAAVALTYALAIHIDRQKFSASWTSAAAMAVTIALGIGIKHLYAAFSGLGLLYYGGRCVFTSGSRRNVIRRWKAVALPLAGCVLGLSYHWLNAHIITEQLRRSASAAATGATAPAIPAWAVLMQTLAPYAWAKIVLAVCGVALLMMRDWRRSLYLVLWIAGGIAGIAYTASVPLSYYFIPLLPAAALICISPVWVEAWLGQRPPYGRVSRALAAILIAGLALFQLQARLGSANPFRLAAGIPYLLRSHSHVDRNPFAAEAYWKSGVVDGNVAVLPYPGDWQADGIVRAVAEIQTEFPARRNIAWESLTDYEWLSGEMVKYRLRAAGLQPEVSFSEPDFTKPLAIWNIGAQDVLLTKSGDIFKKDFYSTPWARASQQLVDELLADNGSELRRRGFEVYRQFPLPDRTVATIWVNRDRLRTYDLIGLFGQADIVAAQPNLATLSIFDIGGDSRTVLFEHPPQGASGTSVTWHDLTIGPGSHLRFGIAVGPDSWGAGKGDGVEFEVDQVSSGKRSTVFKHYIDPKQNSGDRRWFDFDIPLEAARLGTVDLVFITRSGPAGNSLYDHAGWSGLKVVP